MLDKEWAYYLQQQAAWSANHHGKYVVVVGEEVFGFFDDEMEAYWAARKVHEEGTFLIQLCLPGEEAYSQHFYSNVLLK